MIVDSASKVALKSRPENESIEYKMDCGRYVNNVRVVLGRQNNQTTAGTNNNRDNGSRENNIVLAQRNNYNNIRQQPDIIKQQQQSRQQPQLLKKTKNTNFFNFNKINRNQNKFDPKDDQNCIICSESDHLCKQHRILLDK